VYVNPNMSVKAGLYSPTGIWGMYSGAERTGVEREVADCGGRDMERSSAIHLSEEGM
jgi:hypothetical protein